MGDGVSILKAMAAATMTDKVNVARTLTPTAEEKPAKSVDATSVPLDVPGVLFAREGLAEVAADIRKQAAFLLSVAEGIDVILGVDPAVSADSAKVVAINSKLAEREADRRVADREAAAAGDQRAAAREEAAEEREAIQAVEAAEVPGTALPNQVEDEAFPERMARLQAEAQDKTFSQPDAGWKCPTHGTFKVVKSKRGREFRKCEQDCGLIEAL